MIYPNTFLKIPYLQVTLLKNYHINLFSITINLEPLNLNPFKAYTYPYKK